MSPLLMLALAAGVPENGDPPVDTEQSARPATASEAHENESLAFNGLSLRAGVAANYQLLYSVPITSAEFLFAFGGRSGSQSGYLTLQYERGETEYGLDASSWHGGAMGDWAFGRLHAGVWLRVGGMTVQRVTESGDLFSFSIGARGHVGFDVIRFSEQDNLEVQVAFGADYYHPLVFGPSLLLSYRFDGNKRL